VPAIASIDAVFSTPVHVGPIPDEAADAIAQILWDSVDDQQQPEVEP
jgi:hypothetical protein